MARSLLAPRSPSPPRKRCCRTSKHIIFGRFNILPASDSAADRPTDRPTIQPTRPRLPELRKEPSNHWRPTDATATVCLSGGRPRPPNRFLKPNAPVVCLCAARYASSRSLWHQEGSGEKKVWVTTAAVGVVVLVQSRRMISIFSW